MNCNQIGEYSDISKVNYLYDDKRTRGFPICMNCDPLVKNLTNYNWGFKYFKNNGKQKRERKKEQKIQKVIRATENGKGSKRIL